MGANKQDFVTFFSNTVEMARKCSAQRQGFVRPSQEQRELEEHGEAVYSG